MRKTLFLILLFFLLSPVVYAWDDSGTYDLPNKYWRGPWDFAVAKPGNAESVFLDGVTRFGFKLTSFIMPIFDAEKRIALPVLKPFAELQSKFVEYLNPQIVKDNSIPNTAENPVSAIFCSIDTTKEPHSGEIRVDEPAEDVQISENWEYAPETAQAAYNLNSTNLGLSQRTPRYGKYNWYRPTIVMNNADPMKFCDYREDGIAAEPISTVITQLAGFTSGTEVMLMPILSIIGYDDDGNATFEESTAREETRLTEEMNRGQVALEIGHVGDPTKKEVEKSPFPETIRTAVTRGWTFNFLPEIQAAIKPVGNGLTDYCYKVKWFPGCAAIQSKSNLFNNLKERTQQAGCAVVPDGQDYNASIGSGDTALALECDTKPMKCPIDIIKENTQSPADSQCSLSNVGAITKFMSTDQLGAYGSGLSPLAIKVLETAADTYHVPASVLLMTMLYEGTFNTNLHTWDLTKDENIETYSNCSNSEPMPSCSNGNGSYGAFGFRQTYWDRYNTGDKNPYIGLDLKVELEGFDDILKNTTNFSYCNFTDAAFMAARAIYEDYSHQMTTMPDSCKTATYGDVPMLTELTRPSSCGDWSSKRAATTRYNYTGGATAQVCIDPALDDSNSVGDMASIVQ